MQRTSVVSATLLTLLLSACGSAGRIAEVPGGYDFGCDTGVSALYERLNLASVASDPDATVDLLLLSGGGARGAWGAGYLRGWQGYSPVAGSGSPAMPGFHVVTGVSTGALQATHAFLGDYETLYEIYTTIGNEQVWRKRFLPAALFSNSFLSSAPLAEFIEQMVDGALLERVARSSTGRLLCVGAVNLASGRFREWDLGGIAAAYAGEADPAIRKQLPELYRAVLLASASIPLAFPPVGIMEDGRQDLYVDGGTRQNVFVAFGGLLEGLTRPLPDEPAYGGLAGARVAAIIPVRVFVVVNGQLGIAPAEVSNRLVPVARRSFDALMAQSANGALFQIDYELRRAMDTLRGAHPDAAGIRTRYSYIPAEICVPNSALDFDPMAMLELADAAARYGERGEWFEFEPDAALAQCGAAGMRYE